MCNIEFPHFGASYPDAHCIDGYLWDMDSYENGCYTIGGDDPCPFCNTEAWLKTVLDNEEFASREEALAWVEKMREKCGAEHFRDLTKKMGDSSEIPNRLNEIADYARRQVEEILEVIKKYDDYSCEQIEELRTHLMAMFLEGAGWQKKQMMKEAVEIGTTEICWLPDGDRVFPTFDPPVEDLLMPGIISQRFNEGDEVRVFVAKKEV